MYTPSVVKAAVCAQPQLTPSKRPATRTNKGVLHPSVLLPSCPVTRLPSSLLPLGAANASSSSSLSESVLSLLSSPVVVGESLVVAVLAELVVVAEVERGDTDGLVSRLRVAACSISAADGSCKVVTPGGGGGGGGCERRCCCCIFLRASSAS